MRPEKGYAMVRAVTLGEALLRLSAPDGVALENCQTLEVRAAGAESNVAVGLARLGVPSAWISALVDNPLGRLVAGSISRHGVDLGGVVWTDEGRMGAYYIELARRPRPGRIIYDRQESAFARLDPDRPDWSLLDGASVLHLSGITLAINPALARRAIREARARAVPVSWDVNQRALLWSDEDAREAMADALAECTVIKLTAEEASGVLGLHGSPEDQALAVAERWGASVAVVTDGNRGAVAAVDGEVFREAGHEAEAADRVGAGDAFMAGFLYALLAGAGAEAAGGGTAAGGTGSRGLAATPAAVRRGLRLGNAHAALKYSYFGDIAWSTLADVRRLAGELDGQTWR